MEWDDIHDPTSKFKFVMEWSLVGSEYLPEKIQKLIGKKGIRDMVHIVNEHFKLNKYGHPVMFIDNVGKQPIVTQA